jgi:hypothetical protein
MRVHDFWHHWQVSENPFCAEEASDDPVFMRLLSDKFTHPDFAKIYGTPEFPTSAIVCGEKGSGKTALRLTMERHYRDYNKGTENKRVWVVRYDDLNSSLDTFSARMHGRDPLKKFRLEDHQDAMLSKAVTQLVDTLTGVGDVKPGFEKKRHILRSMERHKRLGLCLLTALYDRPGSGMSDIRFRKIHSMAHIRTSHLAEWVLALVLVIAGAGCVWFGEQLGLPDLIRRVAGLTGLVGSLLLLGKQLIEMVYVQITATRLRREIRTGGNTVTNLAQRLWKIGRTKKSGLALPMPGDHDSRYGLERLLLGILSDFGYAGMVFLVDRVDEPAMINGDAQKMKDLVWPMLNNKFLQQEHIGIKMLLPIELRYQMHRENEDFYMKARLDKQCMIDRLSWSGSALYDLANMRLRVCRESEADELVLGDFFAEDVTVQDVIDALGQMQQPRDAFKLLYQIVHQHCSNTPNEHPVWKIPRLTLTQVAKEQSLRLSEMQRGLQPA